MYVWLDNHFADEPELARDLQRFLDETFDLTEGQFYPVTAKEYLRRQGLDIGPFSRKLPPSLPPETAQGIDDMRSAANGWIQRLLG